MELERSREKTHAFPTARSMAFRVFSSVLLLVASTHAFAPGLRAPRSRVQMVATAVPLQGLPMVTDSNYNEGERLALVTSWMLHSSLCSL
jgi:hypothetical protein